MTDPEVMTSLLVLFAIIALGGLVQSAIGFGYAIAVLPLLAFVMDPRSSHILVSLSGVPVLAMSAWTCRKGFQWPIIWPALTGGMLAIPLGILVFAYISPDALIRATGLAILTLILLDFFQPRRTPTQRQSQLASFWAGSVSGFLAGAVSIGGPPVATFAMKQPWTPLQFKAFVIWFLLLTSIVKVIGLGVSGYLDRDGVWQAILVSPFAVFGVMLGSRLSQAIDPQRFRQVIAVVLGLVAASMIYRGG